MKIRVLTRIAALTGVSKLSGKGENQWASRFYSALGPTLVKPEVQRTDETSSLLRIVGVALLLLLSGFGSAHADNVATINWTDVHQIIDGFGGSDATVGPFTAAQQALFFGTGAGQLGLSLLRTEAPNNGDVSGNCTTVNAGCAGPYVSDMKAVIANGGRVYTSPWTPPAAYKTNGLTSCTGGGGNGGLVTGDYAAYATWLANYVQSLKTEYGITLYAISVQNEPNVCTDYDSCYLSPSDIDAFLAINLGPTFAAAGLSTLIFVPEGSGFNEMSYLGSTCAGDSACNQYVGGINWHDYDASLSGTNTVAADPYPSYWPAGAKYWETEASCYTGGGPNFCQAGVQNDITDALEWAAVVDQRIAVDNANAWLYWWLVNGNTNDNEGLVTQGTIAKRAYMLGQYSKFVRPGYYRIDATHLPEPGVSISAYQNTTTSALVIVATNYGNSDVSQEFAITNAPAFSSLTPWITSASLSLAEQPSVPVSSNSFTYTLPADSITTFSTIPPTPPVVANLKISPKILKFGKSIRVGSFSKPRKVTISNHNSVKSGIAVSIVGEAAAAPFAVTSQCITTLAPGKSCKVSVTFSPTNTAAQSGELIVNLGESGTPQQIPLTGTGKAPKK